MAIRGSIVIECDQKGCHAEIVVAAEEFDVTPQKRGGLELTGHAGEWREDDHGAFWCPECVDELINPRDNGYERAAARARNNDFAETGGKDWT